MQRLSILTLVLCTLTGCGGPFFLLAGGALSGPEQPYLNSVAPSADTLIQLETNPDDPYSVNLNARVIGGEVYVDPAVGRKWYEHLAADPRIRIRFDGDATVYAGRVVEETDTDVLALFEPDRIVFRIAAR
ncbi:MAG: hypothetical protein AAF529_07365 [Pseudomonadota bacterium]